MIALSKRRAAVTVEAAIVYPVLFVVLFGLIVGGMGVFRYQLVAAMARDATRYASVRGADWAKETGQTSPTQQQIAQNAVVPLAIAMDENQLTVRIQWVNGISGAVSEWDASTKQPASRNAAGEMVANRVRVTVTYHWFPEAYLGGRVTLQSVSESPMAF